MRMATYDGQLDLADLAGLIGEPGSVFTPKALKAAFPGLRTHDTYAAFAQTLHTRLGIGANGDGAKALRLLVRIQSGQHIRTVDELYKEMVLERPVTFQAADRAIEHFDDLEAAYLAMQTEQEKADLLGPITARYAGMVAAQDEIDLLDTFGVTVLADSPIALWTLRKEEELLEAVVEANRIDRAASREQLRDAGTQVDDLTVDLEAQKEEHRNSGGSTLDRLAAELEQARKSLENREERRSLLAQNTVALAMPLGVKADFEKLRASAGTFLAAYPADAAALKSRRDGLLQAEVPLLDRRRELREERLSLSGRAGRVPKFLDDMRRLAAQAAGLEPEELPFLAELIDMAPDQARWREAVETVLFASARTMLVAVDLDGFSRAIDPLKLSGRLTFASAEHGAGHEVTADPDSVAGKLVFKDSPFRNWVQRHVTEPHRNALCVGQADELAGGGYRVTQAGQTRQDRRGSHGRNAASNIIGFSSAEAIADIDRELDTLERQLTDLDAVKCRVSDDLDDLDRRRRAFDAALNYQWDDIDVPGANERIDALSTQREQILASDDGCALLPCTSLIWKIS